MKKRIIKIIKGLFLLLGVVLILVISAVLWPLPSIQMPEEYSSILVKSIAIIDIKTGEVLKNRDVLIEGK